MLVEGVSALASSNSLSYTAYWSVSPGSSAVCGTSSTARGTLAHAWIPEHGYSIHSYEQNPKVRESWFVSLRLFPLGDLYATKLLGFRSFSADATGTIVRTPRVDELDVCG